MTITMKNIADALDVSVSSVSRVLNNVDKGRVSAELRTKIIKFAKKNNYEFNYAARALKKKLPNSIGFICTYHTNLITDYSLEILRGIIDASNMHSYNLIFDVVPSNESYIDRYEYYISSRMVGGVLILGSILEKENKFNLLNENKLPFVIMNSRIKKDISFVDCDNYGGALKVVEYLIKLGHKEILFIEGPSSSTNALDRKKGFVDGLKRYGVKINENNIIKGDFSEKNSYNAIKRMNLSRKKITAIFASNDGMAIGAIKALQEKGVKIPEDISIIGFDDIPLSTYINPKLTTIRQNLYQIGFEASDSLIKQLEKKKNIESKIIPTELIIRESTKRIKGDNI